MQLLSIDTARAIWLLNLNDLNPRGKAIGPDLANWLKATYGFTNVQRSPESGGKLESIKFSDGKFRCGDEEDGAEKHIYIEFSIYNDGLVADTRSSTKDADQFLNDMLTSAANTLNLAYNSSMIRKVLYLSQVDIRLEREFNFLNPQLQGFAGKISSLLDRIPFDFSGVAFSVHPNPPWQYSPFRIERKVNTPWQDNRYFSSAPLHTEDHIALLEEFEQNLLIHH